MLLEGFLGASANPVFGGEGRRSLCVCEKRLLKGRGILRVWQLIKFHDLLFVWLFGCLFSLRPHSVFPPCFLLNGVAPPQDLQITDPGLLGALDVEWKPPHNVQTFSDCAVKYKLEYRNMGDRDWKVRQSTF